MLFYLFLNQYVKLFLHESVFAPGAVFSMAFFGLCENRPFHDDCSSLFVFADKNPARKDFVLFIINAWIFSLFAGGQRDAIYTVTRAIILQRNKASSWKHNRHPKLYFKTFTIMALSFDGWILQGK